MTPGEWIGFGTLSVVASGLVGGALVRYVLYLHGIAMREAAAVAREAERRIEALDRNVDAFRVGHLGLAELVTAVRLELASAYVRNEALLAFENRMLARFDKLEAQLFRALSVPVDD